MIIKPDDMKIVKIEEDNITLKSSFVMDMWQYIGELQEEIIGLKFKSQLAKGDKHD